LPLFLPYPYQDEVRNVGLLVWWRSIRKKLAEETIELTTKLYNTTALSLQGWREYIIFWLGTI